MELVIAGAAVVRQSWLFVALRTNPQAVAGRWELPGDEVHENESEQSALEREFTTEFGMSLNCVDRILSDRVVLSWPTGDGETTSATLRVYRCQLPTGATFDPSMGEPRPSMSQYEASRWVHLDDLDSVSPWRDADRMFAGEIADYYYGDSTWQQAD